MKKTFNKLKDVVSPSRRRNDAPGPLPQINRPTGSFRHARTLQELDSRGSGDAESKRHVNKRVHLNLASAGATLGESQGSFGASGPSPEGISPRTKLRISANRKKRTLHKFQVSTTTAAAFLAIREDNAFRAKVSHRSRCTAAQRHARASARGAHDQ